MTVATSRSQNTKHSLPMMQKTYGHLHLPYLLVVVCKICNQMSCLGSSEVGGHRPQEELLLERSESFRWLTCLASEPGHGPLEPQKGQENFSYHRPVIYSFLLLFVVHQSWKPPSALFVVLRRKTCDCGDFV